MEFFFLAVFLELKSWCLFTNYAQVFETEGVVGMEVEDRFRERSSSIKQYCPLPAVSTMKTVKTWTEFMMWGTHNKSLLDIGCQF